MTTEAVLRNGETVNQADAILIFLQLQLLDKTNPTALWNLAMRCNNASHSIHSTPAGNSEIALKEIKLLNENGSVPEDVKKIVVNGVANMDQIEKNVFSLQLQNPVISITNSSSWSCIIL